MSNNPFVSMPSAGAGEVPLEAEHEELLAVNEDTAPSGLRPGEYILRVSEPEPELGSKPGPLKKAIGNQDSLYKYISWDDPICTVKSYVGLVGLLLAFHHFHWTQLLLKLSATGLGAVSLVSFVSRSSKNDIIARSRPRYRKIPEDTLNATLRDVHDFIQFLALKLQKVVYGEDLRSTFGAFLSATALFWLIKVVSPFSLLLLALSTLYLGTLAITPRGRELAQDARQTAESVAQATADNARVMASNSKSKAADLSSRATRSVGNIPGNVSAKTKSTADNITHKAHEASDNWSSKSRRRSAVHGSGSSDVGVSSDVDVNAKGEDAESNNWAAESSEPVFRVPSDTGINTETNIRTAKSSGSDVPVPSYAGVAVSSGSDNRTARSSRSSVPVPAPVRSDAGTSLGGAEQRTARSRQSVGHDATDVGVSAGDVVPEKRQLNLNSQSSETLESAASLAARRDLSPSTRQLVEKIHDIGDQVATEPVKTRATARNSVH
ncbi:hypothetical protein GGS20DRAFT_528195 [Poronia punctata]|nr:hypothetical protein GGS20DRAFT_528195 [Poronia punctata]